jgi:hypothetical protein
MTTHLQVLALPRKDFLVFALKATMLNSDQGKIEACICL